MSRILSRIWSRLWIGFSCSSWLRFLAALADVKTNDLTGLGNNAEGCGGTLEVDGLWV